MQVLDVHIDGHVDAQDKGFLLKNVVCEVKIKSV
jgi:hypothetical protein